MTSAGLAAARCAGEGQRDSHSRLIGSTRATGVGWSITSLTSTALGSVPGARQGRSRAAPAYQSTTVSPTEVPGELLTSGAGDAALTRVQSALRGWTGRGRTGSTRRVTGRVASDDTRVTWEDEPPQVVAWRAGAE